MTAGLTLRSATALDVEALVGLLAVLFEIEADFQPDPGRQRDGLALLLAAPALRFYERAGWRGTRLVCLRKGGM